MKTKIRVQEFSNYGYDFKAMQVLEHPYKNSMSIIVLGFIKFADYNKSGIFTSPHLEIDTDNADNAIKISKLFKFIKDNTNYDTNFDEVKHLINAEEYFIFKHEFIRKADIGKNLYSLFTEGNVLYTTFIAVNDIEAYKIAPIYKVDNYKLTSEKITAEADVSVF